MSKITLAPLVKNGWTVRSVAINKDLVSYATGRGERKGGPNSCTCLQCEKVLEIGDQAYLLRDPQGNRRALFCSVACQRQKYFEQLVARRKEHPWTSEKFASVRSQIEELLKPYPEWRFTLKCTDSSPRWQDTAELRLWLNRQDYMRRDWAAIGSSGYNTEIFAAKLTGKEIRAMVLMVVEPLAAQFRVVSLPASLPEFILTYELT